MNKMLKLVIKEGSVPGKFHRISLTKKVIYKVKMFVPDKKPYILISRFNYTSDYELTNRLFHTVRKRNSSAWGRYHRPPLRWCMNRWRYNFSSAVEKPMFSRNFRLHFATIFEFGELYD